MAPSSPTRQNIAVASNAAIVARIAPALDAVKPVFGGVPLNVAQTAFVKSLLPGIKDDAAVAALGRALTQAASTFTTSMSTWGTPPPPKEPLSPAAFAIFQRAAAAAFDAKGGTVDGMVDAKGVEASVSADAKAIGDTVKPVLLALSQNTVRDGATTIPTSPPLAQELTKLLTNSTR